MEYLTDQDYEIAEANGISKKVAYHRFYYGGFEKERAITQPIKAYKGKWRRWKDVAEAHGIGRSTFLSRVNNKGWGEEEAATLPKGTVYNKQPTRITENDFKVAEENGICRATVKTRVYAMKWSVEKAITREIRNVGRRMSK